VPALYAAHIFNDGLEFSTEIANVRRPWLKRAMLNKLPQLGQFALFMIVGGIAALVNIGSRLLFSRVVPFEVAILLAFAVALTLAFILNRRFVFDAEPGKWAEQYSRFFLVNLLGLLQIFVVSELMARAIFPWVGWTWHVETVSHVIGVASPIIVSFYAHKHFSFHRGVAPVNGLGTKTRL
jgi:putative flippase GtrA